MMSTVVERVARGDATWEWLDVLLEHPSIPEKLIVQMMTDAMKIDGIRFQVTAYDQQVIADLIGGIFNTSRTSDERHKAATTIVRAVTQVPPGSGKIMALSKPELAHPFIEKQLPKDPQGIISTIGKPWVVTNQMSKAQRRYGPKTAFNYGWHDKSAAYKSPGGLKIWQPVVDAMAKAVHNDAHADPSQVCEMPSRCAVIIHPSGMREQVDLADIYKHPVYHVLVSYEGPLVYTRQMSVPEPAKKTIVLPPVTITG